MSTNEDGNEKETDKSLSSMFSSLSPSDRFMALQAATSALAGRYNFTRATGYGWDSFDGLRDLFAALGFKHTLTIDDYRKRYERGGIAKVLIDRLPEEMWDDGVFIREADDYDANNLSEYEIESARLWERLDIESRCMKADKLAGLGTHSAILIGVKEDKSTDLSTPLPRLNGPDDILYLLQFAEDNAKVLSLVKDFQDPRFGRPEIYELKTAGPSPDGIMLATQVNVTSVKVHWTRIIHVAHGLLESDWIGTPDLKASWNDLESMYKVAWGGPEAAWRRMDMGLQWEMDVDFDWQSEKGKELLSNLKDQILLMRHNQQRDITTSGVKANPLNAPVDKYQSNLESIVKLIGGTHCIPYTLLLGEELGLRAGENNRETLNIVTQGRRKQFGTPLVRQLQDRLISVNGLPKPRSKDGKYNVVWGVEEELSEEKKAELAKAYAEANKAQNDAGGGLLYTTNEIRDKVGDDPIEEIKEEEKIADVNNPDSNVVNLEDRKLKK